MSRAKGRSSSRIGEQYELGLWDRRVRVPWEGRSPRELTRVALSLTLKARGGREHERTGCDSQQCDLFEKGPFVYEGAPLLLEFLRKE